MMMRRPPSPVPEEVLLCDAATVTGSQARESPGSLLERGERKHVLSEMRLACEPSQASRMTPLEGGHASCS